MGSDVRAYAAKTQTINFWLVRRATLRLLSMSWLTVALVSLTSATALSQLTSSQTTVSQTTGAATPEASGSTLLRPTLKPGSRGSEVTELQATLKLLGYYGGTVDGVYGQSTVSAVSQFQQAAGLNADGITGPATWNRLFPDAVETAGAARIAPTPTANTAGAARIAPTPTANNVSPLPATSGAASFPTPSGVSRPAPTSVTPAASPRPTVKPASGTPAPKPNKPAGTRPAAANTSTPSTASPETVALPILRQGMKGSAVVALQERLRSLGVLKGTADGVFGAETLAAVKAAQRRFKLAPDGVVGPGTWNALLR